MSKKRHKKIKSSSVKNHNRAIFISFLSIVIVVAIATALGLLTLFGPVNEAPTNDDFSLESASEIDENSATAISQADDGDVNGALSTYDEYINDATDDQTKAAYYLNKATLLYNNENYDAALEEAMESFDLYNSSGSAAFIGQIYAMNLNDTSKAIEYYNKAKNLVDENSPVAEDRINTYTLIISLLENKGSLYEGE